MPGLKCRLAFAIFLIHLVLWCPQKLLAFVLADQGRSNFSIVVAQDASLSEDHAARELQKFIQEISGALIPIMREGMPVSGPMILLGESGQLSQIDGSIDFKSLGDEGYVIRTSGEHLIIAGGRLRGTMYGVYGFLEDVLGCRWYTDLVSRIPKMERITLENLDRREVPAFEYREPFWREAFDRDWAARNRTNGHHGELDDVRGGNVAYRGVHTYYPLVPPARYFGDHPEYYSIVAGRRYWEHAQLCETNPEMMRLLTGHLKERMKMDPGGTIFDVSANDWAGICDCEHCQFFGKREESMAGPGLYLINNVSDRVREEFPGKYVGFLAYKHTEKPPKTMRPNTNVVVRMCPIEGCKTHPIEECELNREVADNLKGWKNVADRIYIWDYYTNFRQYLLPFPCLRTIEYDLRFYRSNNVKGMFMQGCGTTRGAYLSELKAFLMAKLLWNPERDRQAIIDDFITGVYGKAAPQVREYVLLFENTVKDKWLHGDIREEATAEFLSEDVMIKAEALLRSAAEIARDDRDLSFRIELLQLPLEFVRLSKPVEHRIEGNVYAAVGTRDEVSPRTLDLFMEKVDKHNMAELREARGLEEQYNRMRANVGSHQIVTLESPDLELQIIPAMGGRIHSLVHKASGKNILNVPDVTDFRYPMTGGFEERLDRGSTINKGQGYAEYYDWVISDAPGGKKITLTGRINARRVDNAVQLIREITLLSNEPAIEISTTLKVSNEGNRPLCINSGASLGIGNASDIRIGIEKADGAVDWYGREDIRDVEPQEERFREHAQYRLFRGREIRGGRWYAVNEKNGLGIINTFNPDEIDVCYVKAGPNPNDFEMRLWGIERDLRLGQTLSIKQKLSVTDNPKELLHR